MPGSARKDIVREGEVGTYHTWSRCVRHAFLMGDDPVTGENFDYRRECLQKLLQYQAGVFAVDIGNYNILSNHFHLLSRIRPDIVMTWSDEEVAWRWKRAWPAWIDDSWVREPTDQEIQWLLTDREKLIAARKNLGSLSWFMARIKEPVAKLFNREQEVTGHFFEQRFGSREILDDPAALACSAYIDLNQVVAGVASSLLESNYSAIQDRAFAWQLDQAEESLETFLRQNRKRDDLELSVEQLKTLFLGAERILSPITTEAPLLLVPESPAAHVESAENIQLYRDQEPVDPPDVASPAQQQERPNSRKQKKKPAISKRPRSHKIHNRCLKEAQVRASDQLFINMPWPQYWSFVQGLSDQHLGPSSQIDDDELGPALPHQLVTVLEAMGLVVGRIAETVIRFHDRFGSKAGREINMRQALDSQGQSHCRGLPFCRDAFT